MESGLIEAYLLDWTLCDDGNEPVVIRPDNTGRRPADVARSRLAELRRLIEIKEAIEAHERGLALAREAEKH